MFAFYQPARVGILEQSHKFLVIRLSQVLNVGRPKLYYIPAGPKICHKFCRKFGPKCVENSVVSHKTKLMT